LKKLLLVLSIVALISGVALAEPQYVSINLESGKYIVHPATVEQYNNAIASQLEGVWFFVTTQPVREFAQNGGFGPYDTYEAALASIQAVDPGVSNIYKPPAPTNPH
jgi:hypothetical protein